MADYSHFGNDNGGTTTGGIGNVSQYTIIETREAASTVGSYNPHLMVSPEPHIGGGDGGDTYNKRPFGDNCKRPLAEKNVRSPTDDTLNSPSFTSTTIHTHKQSSISLANSKIQNNRNSNNNNNSKNNSNRNSKNNYNNYNNNKRKSKIATKLASKIKLKKGIHSNKSTKSNRSNISSDRNSVRGMGLGLGEDLVQGYNYKNSASELEVGGAPTSPSIGSATIVSATAQSGQITIIKNAHNSYIALNESDINSNTGSNNRLPTHKLGNVNIFANRNRRLMYFDTLEEWSNKILLYLFAFWTILCVQFLLMFVIGNLDEKLIINYILAGYWMFVFILSFFKYILKRIARKIDVLRFVSIPNITNYTHIDPDFFSIRQKMNVKTQISFELFLIEFFIQCYYFTNYRLYTVIYLSKHGNNEFLKFCLLVSFHFIGEIFASSICLSKWYFVFTSRVTRTIIERNSIVGNVIVMFLNKDDSNYDQWLIRCYLDTVLRFFVGLMTAFIQLILLAVYRKKYYAIADNEQYSRAGIFIAVETILEFVYFIIVCLYHWKIEKRYIWKPMKTLLQNMRPWQIMLIWCVIYVWIAH